VIFKFIFTGFQTFILNIKREREREREREGGGRGREICSLRDSNPKSEAIGLSELTTLTPRPTKLR
jgi:hypothetical protein